MALQCSILMVTQFGHMSPAEGYRPQWTPTAWYSSPGLDILLAYSGPKEQSEVQAVGVHCAPLRKSAAGGCQIKLPLQVRLCLIWPMPGDHRIYFGW